MIARLMGLETIAPKALSLRLAGEPIAVVDVNAPQSFRQAHVPGAVNLDPRTFTAGDLPAERDHAVVFYCSNPLCRKAPQAARRALAMGYTDVRVLSAGISGWLSAGLPVEPGA
jgi:rhodanese-related sulfurtransferase